MPKPPVYHTAITEESHGKVQCACGRVLPTSRTEVVKLGRLCEQCARNQPRTSNVVDGGIVGFDLSKDLPDSDVQCGRCPGFINIWDKAAAFTLCWNCRVEVEKEMDKRQYG